MKKENTIRDPAKSLRNPISSQIGGNAHNTGAVELSPVQGEPGCEAIEHGSGCTLTKIRIEHISHSGNSNSYIHRLSIICRISLLAEHSPKIPFLERSTNSHTSSLFRTSHCTKLRVQVLRLSSFKTNTTCRQIHLERTYIYRG